MEHYLPGLFSLRNSNQMNLILPKLCSDVMATWPAFFSSGHFNLLCLYKQAIFSKHYKLNDSVFLNFHLQAQTPLASRPFFSVTLPKNSVIFVQTGLLVPKLGIWAWEPSSRVFWTCGPLIRPECTAGCK